MATITNRTNIPLTLEVLAPLGTLRTDFPYYGNWGYGWNGSGYSTASGACYFYGAGGEQANIDGSFNSPSTDVYLNGIAPGKSVDINIPSGSVFALYSNVSGNTYDNDLGGYLRANTATVSLNSNLTGVNPFGPYVTIWSASGVNGTYVLQGQYTSGDITVVGTATWVGASAYWNAENVGIFGGGSINNSRNVTKGFIVPGYVLFTTTLGNPNATYPASLTISMSGTGVNIISLNPQVRYVVFNALPAGSLTGSRVTLSAFPGTQIRVDRAYHTQLFGLIDVDNTSSLFACNTATALQVLTDNGTNTVSYETIRVNNLT